ncbi:uncharacterized protein LOC115680547 [Syzygium oleosum]|uniref:uncharacterized protein LOC115680547 n=1 Tax=Syzygium oleosum TaxID=219896 RepID=UPI0024B9F313|nr:uncharacterized protein LOC115680547 [Syzygium oleosum]
MAFPQDDLDLVLVPSGLLLMFAYNLFFLYRYLRFPKTTVMGVENDDKRAWVEAILQGNVDEKSVGVSVVTSNVSAATFFASVCLTLCSLLGAWIANSPSSSNIFDSVLLFSDPKPSTAAIKHLCLILCFLVSFACFLQSARHHVHASYLITTPMTPRSLIDPEDVKVVVIRGGEFWSLGHRSLYFALSLLLWFFGPVPMFASSVVLVMILHHHDAYSIPIKRRPLGKKTQIENKV